MISFICNTPPKFANLRNSEYHTWIVIEFISLNDKAQKLVRLINFGHPNNEEWEEVYHYFDKAWDYVLDNLVKSCE